jgi:hypothetical protein
MLHRSGLQLAKFLTRLSTLDGLLFVEMLRTSGVQLAMVPSGF